MNSETSSSSEETSSSSSSYSSQDEGDMCLFVKFKVKSGKFPKMSALPKTWWFVGRDTCVKGNGGKFPTEEQYMGDEKYMDVAKERISDYYEKMENKGVIYGFSIRTKRAEK